MRVVLAGLVKTGTFQAGICSTEGLVGRGAKKKTKNLSGGTVPSRDFRGGSEGPRESSRPLEQEMWLEKKKMDTDGSTQTRGWAGASMCVSFHPHKRRGWFEAVCVKPLPTPLSVTLGCLKKMDSNLRVHRADQQVSKPVMVHVSHFSPRNPCCCPPFGHQSQDSEQAR